MHGSAAAGSPPPSGFQHVIMSYDERNKEHGLSILALLVQDALYYLYNFVPVGGYVIFDDLFWELCIGPALPSM